jgi:hypothetical protein
VLPNEVKIEFLPRHYCLQRTPGKVGLKVFSKDVKIELQQGTQVHEKMAFVPLCEVQRFTNRRGILDFLIPDWSILHPVEFTGRNYANRP